MDARTSVAKDLAQISRQDNAAMWSSPNPDSPEIPSTLFPLSLRETTKCRANSFSLNRPSNQSIDYPITRVIHFTSFIPNSEIETVKLYTTLWDDADNFGAEKEERRSRKTFEGGRKQILEKTRSEKKKDKREQKRKGGMEKE